MRVDLNLAMAVFWSGLDGSGRGMWKVKRTLWLFKRNQSGAMRLLIGSIERDG